METIFNSLFRWKELILTDNESRYYVVRNTLAEKNIRNKSKIVYGSLRCGHRSITFGATERNMYYIYVKKEDYEIAVSALNGK